MFDEFVSPHFRSSPSLDICRRTCRGGRAPLDFPAYIPLPLGGTEPLSPCRGPTLHQFPLDFSLSRGPLFLAARPSALQVFSPIPDAFPFLDPGFFPQASRVVAF